MELNYSFKKYYNKKRQQYYVFTLILGLFDTKCITKLPIISLPI